MAVTTSQGSVITFNGITFQATDVSVSYGGGSTSGGGASQLDVSHLGLADGATKLYQSPPLAEVASAGGTGVLATITMNFLDLQEPELYVEHPIDLGSKLKIKGTAKCTEYNLDLKTNDVIRGSAKFDLITRSASYT